MGRWEPLIHSPEVLGEYDEKGKNDEWRGTNWVGRKGSVAYATEILQILKKIKQIGNKLPKCLAQIKRIVFQLIIDNW